MNLPRPFFFPALFALAFAAARLVAAPAPELRAFTAQSLAEIKRAHAGRPFVLTFWSVSCEPCREEMRVVAQLHRKFPGVPMLLVAADAPDTRAAVARVLAGYDLGGIQTWQFADDSVERLRYSVDKAWAGELPRSYFFDARHNVIARSGVVDAQWLAAWLGRAEASARK